MTQVLHGTRLGPPSPRRAPWRLPGYKPPLPMHWPLGTERSEAVADSGAQTIFVTGINYGSVQVVQATQLHLGIDTLKYRTGLL